MVTTFSELRGENDYTSIQNTFSVNSHSQIVAQNISLPDGCLKVNFSEMEYLPWDNPDNIVSADVELAVYRFKINLLAFLFLIGGPANVINMAVFYKQGLKDRVNLCLFALSLADELNLIEGIIFYGEQLRFQFTTKEKYGPIFNFIVNNNIVFLTGSFHVSPALSAIIASERCLCVLSPLKFQTLLRTRTMAAIIIAVYVVVFGLCFIVTMRYRFGCIYNVESGAVLNTLVHGEFYKAHKTLVNFLDSVLFGVGLPAVVMILVITTTVITTVKLRQIMTWRADTSSSISAREVALTKMLVGNSIFFIACISPVSLIRSSWIFFPDMDAGRRNENLFMTSVWITVMLTYINSTFNIFVYYAMGSRYRETFWALFSKKKVT